LKNSSEKTQMLSEKVIFIRSKLQFKFSWIK